MTRIVVVGGYGHVGQKIARRLMPVPDVTVRIAGRDASRARAASQMLSCEWAVLDIADPASWDGALAAADLVICCIDTPSADFPAKVLRLGLDYVDISATDAVLQRIEALDGLAKANDALAVLSVGLAPGLTNLLARRAKETLPQIDAMTIGVLLGLGDEHGPAAIKWTLDNLAPLARSDIRTMRFGPEAAALPTIPFDFADQHVLTRRGYPPVRTRLGLASPLVSATSLRLLSALAQRDWARRLLLWSLPRFRMGSDRAALVVEARGTGNGGATVRRLYLEGTREADITALMAAQVALRVSSRDERGVRHIDELWELEDFAEALSDEGISFGVAER
ncbi:saccharopine dehydrogenase NADP-binding domain-containing protein [Hoeflea sp.]|uniref:saccharopine dehydrogenase NADP-binding domain-containing protein n=1 Tax=Hoeflea sp. TaxID=1940281 RepID=UPI003A8E1D0A